MLVKAEKRKTIVVSSALGGVTNKLIAAAHRAVEVSSKDVECEVTKFCEQMAEKHTEAIETAVSSRKHRKDAQQKVDTLLEKLRVALLGVGYLGEVSAKSMDYIMAFGERMAVTILAASLNSMDAPAKALLGHEAGVVTDSHFGRARPDHKKMRRLVKSKLKPLLDKGVTPVVTGFVGADEEGWITTLGRGGSDYSASLLGRDLKVEEVQIWTDVDGILSTDPKIVPDAKLIPTISYVEAMDLAYFGAKVIHSKMIEPAMMVDIPVRVKNTFNPGSSGTLIVRQQKKSKDIIKAVAVAGDVSIVNLGGVGMAETPNIAGRLFSSLGANNINVIMISGSSESNLSFVVADSDLDRAVKVLKEEFKDNGIRDVGVIKDVSVITVVGAGMQGTKGIAYKVFEIVTNAGANLIMIAQGSSEVNIAFIVKREEAGRAVKALHKRFIE